MSTTQSLPIQARRHGEWNSSFCLPRQEQMGPVGPTAGLQPGRLAWFRVRLSSRAGPWNLRTKGKTQLDGPTSMAQRSLKGERRVCRAVSCVATKIVVAEALDLAAVGGVQARSI